MSLVLLSSDLVEAIHDEVLNPGELTGLARDKSLEATLARVDNRMAYGMIADAFDLAASYAMAISRGHCFNDGNKRTAFRAMQVCLYLNGIVLSWDAEDVGPMIIRCAQGLVEDGDQADWLRERAEPFS